MTSNSAVPSPDPVRGRRPLHVDPLLAPFADVGLLEGADVHVAATLVRLADLGPDGAGPGRGTNDVVGLAAALAVRAARLGSVQVDLTTVARTAAPAEGTDVDLATLPWPDPASWVAAVAASPLVAVGDDGGDDRPLRLLGTRLALDRYWRHERAVAGALTERARAPVGDVDEQVLADGLDRLHDDTTATEQRQAAATAVRHRLSVIAGGPGTGKTTTVARVLALLLEQGQARGERSRVALVAPTGKAATRLQDTVHDEASRLDVAPAVREELTSLGASTIHRLLGRAGGEGSRFRHHAANQLPHQIVVVDETSMVSLTLMARLLEAIRPDARLVLVGDPQQLTSVEAGAVLGDIVGPALADRAAPALRGPLAGHVVVLRRVHRFGGGLAELAGAVQAGDPGATLDVLAAGAPEIRWFDVDVADPAAGPVDEAVDTVREAVAASAGAIVDHARRGDARAALAALAETQILCAHRRGPHGVAHWRRLVEQWLAPLVGPRDRAGWYVGRPVLVTSNDHGLGLFNGDTGVTIADGPRLVCAFDRGSRIVLVNPDRIQAVETLHAMTIHKSQGSQFGQVVAILPGADSPILTRELLYTALTRARRAVTVLGSAATISAAVARPVNRATGLGQRLWPDQPAG